MRKLFSLLAAVLFAGSMMAASSQEPATIAYFDVQANMDTDGEYLYTASTANITAEAAKETGWIGWYSSQSSFKEYNKSGSATCMGTQTSLGNLKYDKITFYVKNCTSFQIQAWANGSDRTVDYSYAPVGGNATTGSFKNVSSSTCDNSGDIALDKTKSYKIEVSNSKAEEIAVTYMLFKYEGEKCPEGLSIPESIEVLENEKLEIDSKLTSGNGTINYTWYKGSVDPANVVAGANTKTLTIEHAAPTDAANYYCVASKDGCEAVTSNACTVTIEAITWLIRVDSPKNTSAGTITGTIGGSADVNLSSSGKLDKNKYVGIKLADDASFLAGDLVKFHFTTAGSTNEWYVFNNKTASADNLIASSATGGTEEDIEFTLENDQLAIYLVRNGDGQEYNTWNPTLGYIQVSRPTQYSITFNANGGTGTMDATTCGEGATYTIPACTFTAPAGQEFDAWTSEDVTIVDGKFTMPSKNVTLTATWKAVVTKWDVTFNLQGHGAAIEKQVVNDGETATEPTTPVDGAYTFCGWYTEAACENAFDFATAITANKELFAKWTAKAATTSLNIEQLVLDNSKNYDIAAALEAAGITYVDKDNLDSLDSKSGNNEPYLGLKFKKITSEFTIVLAAGSTVNVKFGNIGCAVAVSGLTTATIATNAAKVYSFTNETAAQGYLTFKNTADNKTVVLKQVMINEEIKDVDFSYTRGDLTVGKYGTICLGNSSTSLEGAVFFELAGKTEAGIVFEEIAEGDNLEKGKPYLFRATATELKVGRTITEQSAAAGNYNGFYGSYTKVNVAAGNYVIFNNMVQKCAEGSNILANRAYIVMSEVSDYNPAQASARALVIPFNGNNPNVTGVEEATAAKATKALVNGKLVIVRGAKTFDVNGKML